MVDKIKNLNKISVFVSLFVAFLSLAVISCGPSGENTVAVVDGEQVSAEYFLSTTGPRFSDLTRSQKEERLNNFYHTLLRASAAKESGIDQKPEVKYNLRADRRNALVQATYQSYVIDSVITESTLKNAYEHMDERREVRQILVGYKGAQRANASRSEAEAESLAATIQDSITTGLLSFEEAVRRHSEGPSANKNGQLGTLAWGQMVDPFQEKAWELPLYTLSDPVKTRFGYHLIEVTNIDTVELGSFEDERQRIQQSLLRRNRSELSSRAQSALETIKEEVSYTLYDSVLNRVSGELFNAAQTSPKGTGSDLFKYLDSISYSPLGELGGEPISRERFSTVLHTMKHTQFRGARNQSQLVRQLRAAFQREAIYEFAQQRDMDEYRDTPLNLRWQEDQLLGSHYLNNIVLKNFPPPEDSLRAYYDRAKEEKYTTPMDVHVREIYFTSQDTAEMVRKKLDNESDFGALARQYTKRSDVKSENGDLGWFSSERYGPIGDRAASMEPGELAGPIQVGTGWSVIQLVDKKGGDVRPFEEVKSVVKDDYVSKYRTMLIQQNLDSLENEYNAELNTAVIETI